MDRQLTSFSSLTKSDATVQEGIVSSNQAFEWMNVNSHQTHLEGKISQYSYGSIIFSLSFSLFWKNGHYAGIMLDASTIVLYPKLC